MKDIRYFVLRNCRIRVYAMGAQMIAREAETSSSTMMGSVAGVSNNEHGNKEL